MENMFADNHYIPWRKSRINKLINIFGGKEWFIGKKILELGCGHCDTGNVLHEYGANLTCAEGRPEHVSIISSKYPHLKAMVLNQDNPWNLNEKFDLIIHWGVMYHLNPNSIVRDIQDTLKHTDLACFETEVCDSADPNCCLSVKEYGLDQAICEIGSRPSSSFVEREFENNGFEYVRYDDSDINASWNNGSIFLNHRYDWIEKNDGTWDHGKRRFWIVKRKVI